MDKAKLLSAVSRFENTTRRMAELVDGSFDDHRRELVRLRSEMAEQFAEISALGGNVFDEKESRSAFGACLSKARSATAEHQASWPVVAIVPGSPQYLATVVPMIDAQTELVAWIRNALARQG